jgi:hypothetical protein
MRIVSSVTFASVLALSFATIALADLTDPNADTSIPLRDSQLRGVEPSPNVQPADVQPFTNSIANPGDFQLQPQNRGLTNATGGGDTSSPYNGGQKSKKSVKQHSSSSGGLLDAPDQAVKKSLELGDGATKGSLGLTDQAAKASVGLTDKAAKSSLGAADRAAKTSLGVPGKILKSLF